MDAFGALFAPERIALIGATDREGSVGRSVLENLVETFSGDIIPVNPGREQVFELPCVPNISTTDEVDLAIVALPPDPTVEALHDIADAGIQHVVVISAGFGETGGAGTQREQELIELARSADLTLIGPNSLGILSTPRGLNASFGPRFPDAGPISFLSQSGAFITAVLDQADERLLGFRHVVSLGNEATIDQTDCIREWGEDPGTELILGYVEGINDGQTFIDVTRDVCEETPVILVKAGRTSAGARAASSHTGAIAGNEAAYEAGMHKAGAIRARTVQEFFDFAEALSALPHPDSNNVAVLTNAGGPGVMAADAIGESRLALAQLSAESQAAFRDLLPDDGAAFNPLDIRGDADVERVLEALDIARHADEIGNVLLVIAPTGVLDVDELASGIVERWEPTEKPLCVSLMGGRGMDAAAQTVRNGGIPEFFDPSRAITSLEAVAQHRNIASRVEPATERFSVNHDAAHMIVEGVTKRSGNQLGIEAMDLLEHYGISTPTAEIVHGPEEAPRAAERIGEPVVMKIAAPDIEHKTDIGGVQLDVAIEDAEAVYEELLARVDSYQPDATIRGVQVQEQLNLADATETIIGSARDPQFGPMVLFGLGGIFAEALAETTVRIAPVNRPAAHSMIDELRGMQVLHGDRGRPPADVDAVVESIQRVSQLVTDFPAIIELDINPLVAKPNGVQAIDLQVTVNEEAL